MLFLRARSIRQCLLLRSWWLVVALVIATLAVPVSALRAASSNDQPNAASGPQVIVDIAPLHSLVASVMLGVGVPTLIIPTQQSPHHFSLKPSHARALQEADVLFWVSAQLTHQLAKQIASLRPQSMNVELLRTLAPYTNPADAMPDQGFDPHVWLDPANAIAWLHTIANVLASHDRANAQHYTENAARSITSIQQMTIEITTQLEPLSDANYVVFHDAYRHFERAFGLQSAATIVASDARPPSVQRLRSVRQLLIDASIECVFKETKQSGNVVNSLVSGLDIKQSTLDPLGAELTPGPTLYQQLMRNLANSMHACLS